jgi:hypothetical protein
VWRDGSIPEGWNETIVVLIPKVQNLDRLADWQANKADETKKKLKIFSSDIHFPEEERMTRE